MKEEMKELIEKGFGFLDLLLSQIGKCTWWAAVKEAIANVVVIVEAVNQNKTEKKNEALDAIEKQLEDAGIKIPLPDWLLDIILGIAIDAAVNFLNKKFGHSWFELLPKV